MTTQTLQEQKKSTYTLSTVYLYFSQYCNLKCRHCWIDPKFSIDKTPKSDEIDIKTLISALEECRQLGMKSIKVTGGEPFLRSDIFELLDYSKSKNLDLIFETNGTLIGEKEALALKEANVSHVAVSLDGPNAHIHQLLRGIEGSFDKTIEAIKLLKKHNINVQVIISLWGKNKDYIKSTIDLSRTLGVDSVKINIVSCIARADKIVQQESLSVKEVIDFYNELREELEQESPFNVNFDIPMAFQQLVNGRLRELCTCGILSILGILADGRISICGIGSTLDTLVLGRIGQDSIKDIWNNHSILEDIRKNVPDNLEGVCGKCILKSYCLGKCRAEAYYTKGSLLAPLSFCQEAYEQGFFPNSRLVEDAKSNKYRDMHSALLKEFNSAKDFEEKEDLNQFHKNSIETIDRHFETKEITVSHLLRENNPVLGGLNYGACLFNNINKYKKIDKSTKILEVGAGLGINSRNFLKSLEESQGAVEDSNYVFCDLNFKFLESQRNQTASYSKQFIQSNAERLPFKDNSFDIVISNENIADFTSVKLSKKNVLDFLAGKIDTEKIQDASIKKSLGWIKLCSIDISDALPEFIFNLGAFEFMGQINRVLKSDGIAFVSEYGIWKGYPTELKLPSHTEYFIQFPQLIKCIKSLGMDVEVFPLIDFFGFNKEKEVIDGCSLNFLYGILKRHNINLPYLAYTRDMLQERLPEDLFRNFKNLKFTKPEKRFINFKLAGFNVLLIKKRRA